MAVHSHGDTDIVISDYTDGVVTSSLVLGSVKAEDYGHYVCKATNGHGKVRLLQIMAFILMYILKYYWLG